MQYVKDMAEEVNQAIKDDLKNKGIDTTGAASNSLRIYVDGNKVQSWGVDYMYFLDKGRGPGKFPPPDVLQAWVNDKGLSIAPYLVGKKISEEGTEIYKNNSKGIELDKKLDELKSELSKNISKFVKIDVLNKIKNR